MKPVLLDVQHLVTSFTSDNVKTVAVEDVSFQVHEGETVGIVGESGSGKSVTSMSVMRLIEAPSGKIESGTIMFNGRNLLELSEKEMQKVRGHEISMIFQEPTTSLNPTSSAVTRSQNPSLSIRANPRKKLTRWQLKCSDL